MTARAPGPAPTAGTRSASTPATCRRVAGRKTRFGESRYGLAPRLRQAQEAGALGPFADGILHQLLQADRVVADRRDDAEIQPHAVALPHPVQVGARLHHGHGVPVMADDA